MKEWPAQRNVPTSPLVTRADLLARGISRSAISRRVQRGALVCRYPGVYSYGPGELAPAPGTGRGAGVWPRRGAQSPLRGRLLRVSRWREDRPHVVVPRRHWPVEGIVIHHCLGLDPRDVTVVRGVPVTTVARMLVDLGASLTPHQLVWVINEAAFRNRFNLTATRRAMERARGHRGLGVLERALELYAAGSAGTKSRYEDAFLALRGARAAREPGVARLRGRLPLARPEARRRSRRQPLPAEGPQKRRRARPDAPRRGLHRAALHRRAGPAVPGGRAQPASSAA